MTLTKMDPNQKRVSPPKLFEHSVLDCKDDPFQIRHDRCWAIVSNLVTDKGEKEGNEALAAAVSKNDPKAHEDICVGLIVGILGEPEHAGRYYRDLTLVARDGLLAACNHMTALVLDKYPKMNQVARQQLLWLTREMIKSSVMSMENICWNLLRQIAGGDVSHSNLWLAENLLHIFVEHRKWLEKFSFLLASVVYTYLRIIEDHNQPRLESLRKQEVHFVVGLIRERFNDVTVIGRDLLRVLQYVAKIPEFERLWLDLINNPKSLSPTFTGVTSLMHTRTSRRFLQSRITPEMEKKLVFLTSQVRFGTHKRYQDWFQRQYLSTLESQSLRCDLIRFIVGVIHPTNELLGSDIIPRWAVIGWLLTTCTNQVASSNAKLALFYDWLFFQPDKDNIMNIEPAILVMHHSMRPHPAITATLLDFLCRISVNFFPKEREKVHTGITNSLKTILDKRVLPCLLPLFDNPRLDEELRLMLRERFPMFVVKDDDNPAPILNDRMMEDALEQGGAPGEPAPRFSDDEDEKEDEDQAVEAIAQQENQKSSKSKAKQKRKKLKKSDDKNEGGNADDEEGMAENIREILRELKQETKNEEKKCEIMDNLIRSVIDGEYEFEHYNHLAAQLFEVLPDEFVGRIFPEDCTPQSVEDSIGRPIFVLFRALCETMDTDPNRSTILHLLAELYALSPRIGYYLLYFLSADVKSERTAKEKASIYGDLCEAVDENYSLELCLVNDMRQCQEDDVYLFVHLVPEIFTNFPKQSVGNTDLLYLVVSCVDGSQVQRLVCQIVAKEFIMFKKDSFQNILSSSLNWETFEQYSLWHLANAHDLPVDCVIPLLPKLSFHKHSEALTFILLLLKQERPTAELLKSLLTREAEKGDRFVTSALIFWMQEYGDKLGDLVSTHLCKQASLGSTGKRERNQPVKNGTLSSAAEVCLTHLDMLRQNIKQNDFFNQRSIQSALQHVRNSCADTQKKKFMDLFALADSDSEDNTIPSTKNSNSRKNSKPSANSTSSGKSPGKSRAGGSSTKNNSSSSKRNAATAREGGALTDSSEESSDDSEIEFNDRNSRGNSKRSSNSSLAAGSRGKNQGRKRAAATSSKVSYKIYSDDSSDNEDSALKRPPNKKKKVAQSDSD